MSVILRRRLPLILLWIPTIVFTINFFTNQLSDVQAVLSHWGTIILSCMLMVATGTYLTRSLSKISTFVKEKKILKEAFILEVGTLILFFAILITTLIYTTDSEQFLWIENWLYIPGETVAWGIAPLYFTAACYRTWRIRTIETFLLVISFILVCIRGAPIFGVAPWIMEPGTWLATVLTKGPLSVLQIGAGIGILAMIVRSLLGRHAILD